MQGNRSEYDRGVNTFSPEGRLFQVEYALEAVKLGSTAVAVKTNEGVVLASERRVASPLVEPRSVEKIFEIDRHVGCASSGLIADARTLIDHARLEAQNHRFTYEEPMPVESVVEAISSLALDFSGVNDRQKKKTMSRPFGVAFLVAGADKTGPSLWCTDPSGTNTRYAAAAIGAAQEGAESILQEHYREDMTLKESEVLALTVLRQVMEETLTSTNVEIARIVAGRQPRYETYTATEIQEIVQRLPEPTHPTAASIAQGAPH